MKDTGARRAAAWVSETMVRETEAQRRVRAEAERLPQSYLQSTPDTSNLLALLARLMGARRVLELGTFLGYTALTLAQALPPDGEVVVCEANAAFAERARRTWDAGEVSDRIALRLGPAQATLAAMLRAGEGGTFDLAYIDADKEPYGAYYELCLELVRPGGLIALDNMLWYGMVADPNPRDPETRALRALNLKVRDDARVDCSLLTVGDGVLLARKRLLHEVTA